MIHTSVLCVSVGIINTLRTTHYYKGIGWKKQPNDRGRKEGSRKGKYLAMRKAAGRTKKVKRLILEKVRSITSSDGGTGSSNRGVEIVMEKRIRKW